MSKPFDVPKTDRSGKKDSQQELWVIRHQYEKWENEVIMRALRGMGSEEQELVKYRYIERLPWHEIADQLNRANRACFNIRNTVLLLMAYEFGLLSNKEFSDELKITS